MLLIDKLKKKALDAVKDEAKHKEWLEGGFDKAVSEMRGQLPAKGSSEQQDAVRSTASYGLDKVVKHRATLVGLGEHGLRSTFTMIGMGQPREAARHAALIQLRKSGSWDDATNVLVSTTEDGNQAKRDLDAKINKIEDAILDIGVTAAKAVLPFLFAV